MTYRTMKNVNGPEIHLTPDAQDEFAFVSILIDI